MALRRNPYNRYAYADKLGRDAICNPSAKIVQFNRMESRIRHYLHKFSLGGSTLCVKA